MNIVGLLIKPCISKTLYLFSFCLLIRIKSYAFTDKSL